MCVCVLSGHIFEPKSCFLIWILQEKLRTPGNYLHQYKDLNILYVWSYYHAHLALEAVIHFNSCDKKWLLGRFLSLTCLSCFRNTWIDSKGDKDEIEVENLQDLASFSLLLTDLERHTMTKKEQREDCLVEKRRFEYGSRLSNETRWRRKSKGTFGEVFDSMVVWLATAQRDGATGAALLELFLVNEDLCPVALTGCWNNIYHCWS